MTIPPHISDVQSIHIWPMLPFVYNPPHIPGHYSFFVYTLQQSIECIMTFPPHSIPSSAPVGASLCMALCISLPHGTLCCL